MEDLYSILSNEKLSETIAEAVVSINPKHEVFKGHFPQQPVMPGVCQLEIFTAVASQFLEKKLELKEASNMKFLQMLDPNICSEVKVQLEIKNQSEEGVKIFGKLFSKEHIYFKFRGTFQEK